MLVLNDFKWALIGEGTLLESGRYSNIPLLRNHFIRNSSLISSGEQ